MNKEIIKDSFFIKLYFYIITLYSCSKTKEIFLKIRGIYKKSATHRILYLYFNKDSTYNKSFTYRILNNSFKYVIMKLDGVRKILIVNFKTSIFVKLIKKLLIDKNIFVYLLGFYALIDFYLRKLLPSIAGIWDELYILFFICLGSIKILYDGSKNLKYSPIDYSILGYIVINFLSIFLMPYDLNIVLAGFRANVFFILWFYIIFQWIDSTKTIENLFNILIFVVFLISAYGVFQYIVGVPMPKASWVDSVELNVRTRAFSIIGSPNILGSIIVLVSPLAIGMFIIEKNIKIKILYFFAYLTMLSCLVFTLSRGAWIVYCIGILTFIFIKDKKLLVPGILVIFLAILFIPSIQNRVAYMISPEYIKSSLKGGRLIRWITGFEMVKQSPILGVGLGHFGGAVAYNYRIANTFYLDNYYMKIAVELGIIGFMFFQYLMYSIIRWGLVAINRVCDKKNKELLIASFVGISSVTVHNYVENIFEVPMMVTYYYLILACMFNLWYLDKNTYMKEV